MNALELCDELEACGQFFEDRLYRKAAKMLRQQQSKIDSITKIQSDLVFENETLKMQIK